MRAVNRVFNWVENISLFLSKCGLLIMMILVSSDAIGRYLFGKPIVGTYEFVEMYLMILIVFLSMSYVMRIKGHIRLDILIDVLPKKLQNKLNALFYIMGAIWFFIIGYFGMVNTFDAWSNNLVQTGIVTFPLWLSYIWVPLGAYLIAIRLVLLGVDIFLTDNATKEE
jgi:TRAP-type C4-dicarboxylate transport system permease small subunit